MANRGCIAICMAAHNDSSTILRAIASVLGQTGLKRDLVLVISDDGSDDETVQLIQDNYAQDERVLLFQNRFNSAPKNRNWLQQYVQTHLPNCILMGRLDADDDITEGEILSQIEQQWDASPFDVLLMSNHQTLRGVPTGHVNRPEPNLTDPEVLLKRVGRMAAGDWVSELPSCNVFIRPQIALVFPETASAEDHWNLVRYLLKADTLRIQIKPDLVYANYSIDNFKQADQGKKAIRSEVRAALHSYVNDQMKIQRRKEVALSVLMNWNPAIYSFLGSGFSGVVFHDGQWVYKVHLPLATNNFNEVDNILFLKEKLSLFIGRKHFYPLRELTEVNGNYVLVYPYEIGERVDSLDTSDMLSFLAEMWKMKVICRSITKGNNFIRVNGVVKLIDYEIEPYDDNLFLNVVARAFIQLDDVELHHVNYNKLKRSIINNFSIPELSEFYSFVKRLFRNIALSDTESMSFNTEQALMSAEDVPRYPDVTLLIKACPQDSRTLYNDVSIQVSQLTESVRFAEKVILLDCHKEHDFVRQYTDKGTVSELMSEAQRLLDDEIAERIIIPPSDSESIKYYNSRAFGIASEKTHTIHDVPVTAQLFAFLSLKTRFVLQMDVDVIIGRKATGHDYLSSLIEQLNKHQNAVGAGFQIYHSDSLTFQNYFGFDGTVPPDVRCSLIDLNRLKEALPLPNTVSDDGWEVSWYRSLEKHQKQAGLFFIRGGETSTYYVHIQNYRKANRKVWWRILQGVLYGDVPQKQVGNPEVSGNIFDWCLPKRNEKLVVVLVLDEVSPSEWSDTLNPILNQTLNDFELLIINNTGDFNATTGLRQMLMSRSNCTVIDNENRLPFNEAVYDAVHYYMTNQESFICLMRQGDILLYSDVFREALNRLEIYGADAIIGKEISERWLPNCGKSVSDFLNPRENPESIANGLAIFRKYLFDSIGHLDMKERVPDAPEHIAAFTKIKRTHAWMDDMTMLGIIVPIIEMSSNPIRFDNFNILRMRPVTSAHIDKAKHFLKSRPKKLEGSWEKGRKTFIPNVTRIELDITYECNLKCHHCNRSCTQAPTETHMTLSQVKHFVEESIHIEKQWDLINLLGGEPSIHPQFEEIVDTLLQDYIVPHSPKTTLQVTSNGFGELVQRKLAALPKHPNLVIDYNSFKTDKAVPYFTPFNLAPVDDPDTPKHEYHKGCWVTSFCGIGLNHLGYFACGVAGGIERILKAGEGIQSLEELDHRLREQLETYCRFCGNFTAYAENLGDFMERAEKDTPPKVAMSETWRKLYRNHNNESD